MFIQKRSKYISIYRNIRLIFSLKTEMTIISRENKERAFVNTKTEELVNIPTAKAVYKMSKIGKGSPQSYNLVIFIENNSIYLIRKIRILGKSTLFK